MAGTKLHIGVDFDNTIVAYDELFRRLALEEGLIGEDFPASKSEIRNTLRRRGEEPAWTALQGIAYGRRILEAEPFPGVLEFFSVCRKAGVQLSIVSHKTLHPIAGKPVDLHGAAYLWLDRWGFLALLPSEQVYFEITREAKLQRIRTVACTHFIDDLPEFLTEPLFPPAVERILFDPNGGAAPVPDMSVATSWLQIRERFAL